jgi:hypothetical protein
MLGGTWAETGVQEGLADDVPTVIGEGVGRYVGRNDNPRENGLLLLGSSGIDNGGRDKSAITAQRDTAGLVQR